MTTWLKRLAAVALIAFAALTPARAAPRAPAPIVLVHGNGESSSFWTTFKWRLEANGWPSDRIFALDITRPLARSSGPDANDGTPTPGRSSTAEARAELAAAVERVRKATGAEKVILIGHSRGGNLIRDFLWSGGAPAVERVVLAAAPTHGIVVTTAPLNEFNRNGDYLRRLNAHEADVPPGVPTLALRSDGNDVWYQDDGRFVGFPGQPIGAGAASPEARGAANRVLPGADHKQTALSSQAFREIYAFVAGRPPVTLGYGAGRRIVLDGVVRAFADGAPSNAPVAGAKVEVYRVSARTGARLGGPERSLVTGPDGRWGPFQARPGASYEFVVSLAGLPVTHIYREPFPRSSDLVGLSPLPRQADEAKAGSVIVMARPRGLFGPGRDRFDIDGRAPAPRASGVYRPPIDPREPVPAVAAERLLLEEGPDRPVVTRLDGRRIVVRNWPAAAGHMVVAEYNE